MQAHFIQMIPDLSGSRWVQASREKISKWCAFHMVDFGYQLVLRDEGVMRWSFHIDTAYHIASIASSRSEGGVGWLGCFRGYVMAFSELNKH